MFCAQCEETNNNTGCTKKGVCGKQASTANIEDEMVQIVKEISIALGDGAVSIEMGELLNKTLFMTITNANFDDIALKRQLDYCKEIKSKLTKKNITAPLGVNSHSNPDVVSLREMILYGIKGIAAYIDHAAMIGFHDPEIYAWQVKTLAKLSKEEDINNLIALTLETGKYCVKGMELLDKANTSRYGKPEMTKVNIGVGTRPGILVSGHDLRDLEDLLEQTKDSGVDVYTHGEMLPARGYPFFKRYPHLRGNYGGPWFRQDREFGPFNGPIFMTTNCIVPVRKEYKDRIFTTGAVGWPELKHIPDRKDVNGQKDFSEIVALAKTCPPPKELEKGQVTVGLAHDQVLAVADKIVEGVKNGQIKKFVCMGGCDGRHKERDYYTKVAKALPKDTLILTAGCAKYRYNKLDLGDINGIPRVIDAGQCNDSYSLAIIALKLKKVFGLDDVNKLPLAFDIAWYEQKAACILLALLFLGFKNIRVGPTLPGFLSPNVANVLVKNFGIKGIGSIEDDLKDIL
uniref:Hydroxylamine reductase n=1 Tax=Trichomonas vaginalis TaxID=5722 RepID=Q8WR12_TRIVA|nr:hybrid-cluster protein [Trichomonas vaginalis]